MSEETTPSEPHGDDQPSVRARVIAAVVGLGALVLSMLCLLPMNWWGIVPGAFCWLVAGACSSVVLAGKQVRFRWQRRR